MRLFGAGADKGEASGSLRLPHITNPDGRECWESRGWEQVQPDLRSFSPQDGAPTFVVVSRLLSSCP